MDLCTFVENGILDGCKYAEIIQIVLLEKESKQCWNYFTHILFVGGIDSAVKRVYLTNGPLSINSSVKVIISKEVLEKEKVLTVLEHAVERQKWEWKEDIAQLDEVFPIDPQFIPETDPTGSKTSDSTLVPLELSLYGSKFKGGYYLCELFSTKNNLSKILSGDDIKRIQKKITDAKLCYNLEKLSDRIGNIVCKIPVSMIKHKLDKFTPERGIAGRFILSDSNKDSISCSLQIVQENDNTIIKSKVENVVLSKDSPVKEYSIEANRYKNTIILSDDKTGIIYYSAIRDYSYGSNYYAMVTPPRYGIQSLLRRTLILDGVKREIELTNIAGVGDIFIKKEIFEMEKRQHKWMTEYEHDHCFFKSFVAGQEKEAIEAVVSICNDKDLFWDLQEIWLVDPYLSANDILKTVVFCGKYGINIKCLTHITTINGNIATRIEDKEVGGVGRTNATVMKFREILTNTIPEDSDMKLEFRTASGTTGVSFHDRYLILKYGINKSRVWSLGISVNSLGKSHHILQIVQSPMDVIDTIDTIWGQSSTEACLIYKN